MKERFQAFFDEFYNFANDLSEKAGLVKKTSNKAGSYRNYLAFIFVLFEKNSNIKISEPNSLETYQLIRAMVDNDTFKSYNKNEHYYPSATLKCYIAFLSDQRMREEMSYDMMINNASEQDLIKEDNENDVLNSEEDNDKIKERRKKILLNGRLIYQRSIKEVILAKEKFEWKCEINPKHETFIAASNNKPYVEAHHVIPMAVQELYESSLDISENISCLCPTCHRKIHLAKSKEKGEMIEYLHSSRKEMYFTKNINVKLDSLFNYYNIF
ncbi:HNH endonuclease [Macrococcus lamae]|uniref:HNH endonuclease n=1 Tax=Macrococcus lamae TaxID=198484 RepID=A0A4R6BTF1_9STAP|nr:HNH endonuclease signature motif containing protein [Macrococcus lamae]TDM07718.1 HNH endonuclease [Macrococcus lamae]